MDGYDLANEVFRNIGLDENHEISLNDTIRVISFWGFNEEASKTGKIGFVCSCARDKLKKIFEKTLIWNDYSLYNELISYISESKIKSMTKEQNYMQNGKSDVLDKIRAEVEQAKTEIMSTEFAGNSAYRFYNKGLQKALSIIDNHIQKGEENKNDKRRTDKYP